MEDISNKIEPKYLDPEKKARIEDLKELTDYCHQKLETLHNLHEPFLTGMKRIGYFSII